MSDTPSGADILARLKPRLREESTQIYMCNDLLDEWAALQEQLAESQAKDMAGNRMADGQSKKTKALAEKITELEALIAEDAIDVRFRAMSKDRWRALCDEHPPRKGDQVDAYTGYNRDAVLDAAVKLCMVAPVFEDCPKMLAGEVCAVPDPETGEPVEHADCGSWQHFERVCNPAEWKALSDTVNSVNRGVVDAPKSALASRILGRPANA